MVAAAPSKLHPVSMRLPDDDLALIDRAAALRGRTRTDFVRDAAVRAAEETLLEQQFVRMSPDGFANFQALLAAPTQSVPEMVDLLRRPAPWEAGYGPRR